MRTFKQLVEGDPSDVDLCMELQEVLRGMKRELMGCGDSGELLDWAGEQWQWMKE